MINGIDDALRSLVFKLKNHIFIILILLVSANSFANDISIDELVGSGLLKESSSLKLEDSSGVYKIKNLLGSGNTTKVFEIENQYGKPLALRVPKDIGQFNTFSNYSDYIDAYYLGHEVLKRQGVSIPKIYEYKKQEFLIVEKMKIENALELKELFFNNEKIDNDLYKEAFKALDQFVKETTSFTKIKDFHLGQVVYSLSEKKWILIDWTLSHDLFKNINDKNIFDIQALNQVWKDEIYYRKGGDAELGEIPDFMPRQDLVDFFNNAKVQIENSRRSILKREREFIKEQISSIKKSKSLIEFKAIIERTPKQYSQNYLDTIISIITKEERFSTSEILSVIPSYLSANNNDYKTLITSLSSKITSLEELLMLFNIRDNIGIRLDWATEQRIQKLITTSDMIYPDSLYKELVNSPLVTNYARAWIKREYLDIKPSVNCNDAIKGFTSNK